MLGCMVKEMDGYAMKSRDVKCLQSYRSDVLLEDLRDGLSMLRVLLCNQSQVVDFIAIVVLQVLQRVLEVQGHLVRGQNS